MDNIIIREDAGHFTDRVSLADIRQELVPQPFTFGCAFDDARDIHKRHCCRNGLIGIHQLRENRKPGIRERDDARIGLNGGKRVVFRKHIIARQSVKKGRFAYIGQANDSNGKRHAFQFRVEG